MLDLPHQRGLLTGTHYARSLLRPSDRASPTDGHVMSKPRCPYWCPLRNLVWRLGFSLGVYQVLCSRK
jgi:hypothetical protein